MHALSFPQRPAEFIHLFQVLLEFKETKHCQLPRDTVTFSDIWGGGGGDQNYDVSGHLVVERIAGCMLHLLEKLNLNELELDSMYLT